MLSASQLSCLSLSMSLGLSGLKADIGKIGRIRSLQVALIFDTPVPPRCTTNPHEFRLLDHRFVFELQCCMTSLLHRGRPIPKGLTTWRNAHASCRWPFSFLPDNYQDPSQSLAVNPLWESEYTSECTATGCQTSGTSSRSVPITQIGSLSLASLPWEVLITTAWVSSRRARAARQSSIQMEKIFKKWVLSLLLQGVLLTSTCGRTFTSSRIRLTKIVTKPKEWNDDASLCLQPFRVQNYLQLWSDPTFLDLFTNTSNIESTLFHANKLDTTFLKQYFSSR